jgi:hypothetical protein
VTTLRAAIQYIYGLQNLLDEIQTGTLDLAAYQLTEAELRPPPSNKPSAPQLKPAKKGGRQNGGTSVRKPAQRRKPVHRPQPHAASAPAGGGGGLRSGPVTLAMKASCGLPPPPHRKSEKRPSPPMAAVASSAPPEPAARYVLPLQPRDASHVLRRDYAPACPPRQPSVGLPLGKAAAAPTASVVTSSLSPNLLSLRPLPVSALFPGSAMQQQPPLPSLQTLRHPRTTAGGGEGEKSMINVEEVHNSNSSGGSSTAFYCTTAGMYKRLSTLLFTFDSHCSFLNISCPSPWGTCHIIHS